MLNYMQILNKRVRNVGNRKRNIDFCNKKRVQDNKKKGSESKDFSAFEKEAALKKYNEYTWVFSKITPIRQKRNNLVHNLLIDTDIKEIRKHSWDACELVVKLFNNEYGIDVHINGSFQFDHL